MSADERDWDDPDALDGSDDDVFELPGAVNFVLLANTLAAGFFAYLGSVRGALIVLGGNVAAVAAIVLATAYVTARVDR